MVTVYDLLEVSENASKEEIEKAYQKLIIEYHKDPKLSEEENNDNEIILNKLKLAYDILSNDEKRKKYDAELSKRRAEELIKNVTVKNNVSEEVKENTNVSSNVSAHSEETVNKNVNNVTNNQEYEENDEVNSDLSDEEKQKLRKAANSEFKQNLKKAQKAEEEYNRAYNEAYNNYLRKMGYNVKEPWTWKRVKTVLITIFAIIIVCVLFWIIPPIRKVLIELYEENIIVKSLVDICIMIVNAFIGIFKK
jgi:curved DNA-binding protein CbpA